MAQSGGRLGPVHPQELVVVLALEGGVLALQLGAEDGGAVVHRIAAAASELRDLVTDAWNASATTPVGYPAATVADIEAGKVDAYPLLYGAD